MRLLEGIPAPKPVGIAEAVIMYLKLDLNSAIFQTIDKQIIAN